MTTHVGLTTHAAERLDWLGFLARFYPDARRHDYVSLAAYLEYKKAFGPPSAVSSSDDRAERSRS